jgi:hypothetical protein
MVSGPVATSLPFVRIEILFNFEQVRGVSSLDLHSSPRRCSEGFSPAGGWELVAVWARYPTPRLLVLRVVTRRYLILRTRTISGGPFAFDSSIDAGIYFVLLLVRVVHKWVAVMYLNSKWKLSFHQIPQYLPWPFSGAGRRELGARRAGGCLFFCRAETISFENAAVSEC